MEPNKCYRVIDSSKIEVRQSVKSKASGDAHQSLTNPEILAKPLVTMINEQTASKRDNDNGEIVEVNTLMNPGKLSPEKGVTVKDEDGKVLVQGQDFAEAHLRHRNLTQYRQDPLRLVRSS
jgi:hypothetical protein